MNPVAMGLRPPSRTLLPEGNVIGVAPPTGDERIQEATQSECEPLHKCLKMCMA